MLVDLMTPEAEATLDEVDRLITTVKAHTEINRALQVRSDQLAPLLQRPSNTWTRQERAQVNALIRDGKRINRTGAQYDGALVRARAILLQLAADDLPAEGQHRLTLLQQQLATISTAIRYSPRTPA